MECATSIPEMNNPQDSQDQANSEELVPVGTYSENISAEAAKSCLEMEGIEAQVFDGLISTAIYNSVFGGVKVMVARGDLARAQEILSGFESGISEDVVSDQEEITPESVHCPNCHSRKVRSRAWWNLPSGSIAGWVARWLSHTIVTRCRDCGFAVRS